MVWGVNMGIAWRLTGYQEKAMKVYSIKALFKRMDGYIDSMSPQESVFLQTIKRHLSLR